MKLLICFVGLQDPYSLGLIGEEEQPGPILAMVGARRFDRILLLATRDQGPRSEETRGAVRERCPHTEVGILELPLDNLNDGAAILGALRRRLLPSLESFRDADLCVSLSSGTPQTHTAWILLSTMGEIDAQLLQVIPPGYPTGDRPRVTRVTLDGPMMAYEQPACLREESQPLERDLSEAPADSTPGYPFAPPIPASICPSLVLTRMDDAVSLLGLVGDHPSFRKALETTELLGESVLPILILGETGTGKELFAKLAHRVSGRSPESFVPLNCAAIPHDLAESLLFGHRKGAFTGAVQDQAGKFEQADGGTLFLDELGELPASSQAKLLRVLEDGIVEPLGARKGVQVEVRVIAATQRDLAGMVREKAFREDLYYRLRQGVIELPALRDRRSDIPRIALHVLERLNASLRFPKRFSQDGLKRLENHAWPGNIRELQGVIRHSALLCRKPLLEADDLLISAPDPHADPLAALPDPQAGFSLEGYLKSVRKQMILRALEKARGNQSEAARLLGISPQAVHQFLRNQEEPTDPPG